MVTSIPPDVVGTRPLAVRPTLRDTIEQTGAMAWRALLKMRRNPEQFFDVTLQPLPEAHGVSRSL